jgi:hypothetical protein
MAFPSPPAKSAEEALRRIKMRECPGDSTSPMAIT